MPRRKKGDSTSYDERITQVDEQISECRDTLASLKNQRKALESARDEEAMQNIYDFIRASDMSPTEFLDELRSRASMQDGNE